MLKPKAKTYRKRVVFRLVFRLDGKPEPPDGAQSH
jgi:hypothetical protein